MQTAVEDKPRLHFPTPQPSVCPSEDEINTLADLLNRSKRTPILGGAGWAGAHAELIELAGKLQAPIVHALRGKESIEYENSFDVGTTGTGILFGLPRNDELRCVANDWNRLSIPAILSQGLDHRANRTSG